MGYCSSCDIATFLFNHVEDDEEFLVCIANVSIELANDLNFDLTSNDSDSRYLLTDEDIDPYCNFLIDHPGDNAYSSPYSMEAKLKPGQ